MMPSGKAILAVVIGVIVARFISKAFPALG